MDLAGGGAAVDCMRRHAVLSHPRRRACVVSICIRTLLTLRVRAAVNPHPRVANTESMQGPHMRTSFLPPHVGGGATSLDLPDFAHIPTALHSYPGMYQRAEQTAPSPPALPSYVFRRGGGDAIRSGIGEIQVAAIIRHVAVHLSGAGEMGIE